jgi:hypothetical protein
VRVQGKAARGFSGNVLALSVLILLLIPVAQAAAAGTMHVEVEGPGQGEVSSVGGVGAFKNKGGEFNGTFEGFGNAYEGSPPIECSGPPRAGLPENFRQCESADLA